MYVLLIHIGSCYPKILPSSCRGLNWAARVTSDAKTMWSLTGFPLGNMNTVVNVTLRNSDIQRYLTLNLCGVLLQCHPFESAIVKNIPPGKIWHPPLCLLMFMFTNNFSFIIKNIYQNDSINVQYKTKKHVKSQSTYKSSTHYTKLYMYVCVFEVFLYKLHKTTVKINSMWQLQTVYKPEATMELCWYIFLSLYFFFTYRIFCILEPESIVGAKVMR